MHELIEVNSCPLCRNTAYKIAFKQDIYTGKQCLNCRLVYISPVFSGLEEIYTDDVSSSPSTYYKLSEESDLITFDKRLDLIEQYVNKGRLMDIGCSVGNFLTAAGKRGWNTAGIEPNPHSAEACRRKNLAVENGFLSEELALKYSRHFDAIYLGDVIEHTENPVHVISLASRMLKPGGILMIVTPDFNSFIARRFQIKPREHILYFNESSLKYAANLAGKKSGLMKTELIKKTTRHRSLKAMEYSTTFSNKPAWKKFLRLLSALYFNIPVNIFLQLFVRDEILIIIRNNE